MRVNVGMHTGGGVPLALMGMSPIVFLWWAPSHGGGDLGGAGHEVLRAEERKS